uniref:BTB domain-containing protein n=1 Tax=Poecilia mexicana TaxID=48701 RepID=A0A3B3XWJ3_9TELE
KRDGSQGCVDMCDVVLEAGGVSFPCHRSLLASSSDYFWALFGETTAERSADSIRLPALTPEGLEAILDFLYSGWLSISSSTLPVVVEAARYLQVEAALSICERFMADGLTADNCCYYANLAEQHFLLNALEAANQTIAKKMSVLLQKSRVVLLGLNFPSLMAVLDADEIPGVKEVDLIRLSLDWLDENGPLPLLKSNLLLSRLRFGLVAPSELSGLFWRYDPRFNHWKQMESMLERRVQFTLCVVEDVIYAIGGRQSHPNSMTYISLAYVEYYDMASGAWRRAAAMPYPLHGHASTVLDKSIYPTVWEKRASMSIPRFGHRLATAHGYIYALLGMYEQFCDIERYDPQSNHWTRLKPLANGLFNYGMLTMAGGNLLVFGGRRWSDGQQVTVRNVLEYDTKKDQWREIAQLPRPLTGTECTLLPLPD